MLDGMYVTKSISTGLYPNLDLWTANKLQLQLQLHNTANFNFFLRLLWQLKKWLAYRKTTVLQLTTYPTYQSGYL